MLLEGKKVSNFHLRDTLLCHLGHVYVPLSEHAKTIWLVHYNRVIGHFEVEKIMVVLQKYFYLVNLQQDFGKYIRSFIVFAITKTTIKMKGLYIPLPIPSRPW